MKEDGTMPTIFEHDGIKEIISVAQLDQWVKDGAEDICVKCNHINCICALQGTTLEGNVSATVDVNRDSTSDIKFDVYTNSNAFSIRCGKCADIHNAQLEGKTTTPCSCSCHETYTPYVNPIDPCCPQIPWYPTFTGTIDCYTTNQTGLQADIDEAKKRSGTK